MAGEDRLILPDPDRADRPKVWIVAGPSCVGKSEFMARHGGQLFPGHVAPMAEFISIQLAKPVPPFDGMVLHWNTTILQDRIESGQSEALLRRLSDFGPVAAIYLAAPVDEMNARCARERVKRRRPVVEWSLDALAELCDLWTSHAAGFGIPTYPVLSSNGAFASLDPGGVREALAPTESLRNLPPRPAGTVGIARPADCPPHEI